MANTSPGALRPYQSVSRPTFSRASAGVWKISPMRGGRTSRVGRRRDDFFEVVIEAIDFHVFPPKLKSVAKGQSTVWRAASKTGRKRRNNQAPAGFNKWRTPTDGG